jgi:hypothetical protein
MQEFFRVGVEASKPGIRLEQSQLDPCDVSLNIAKRTLHAARASRHAR